MLNFFRCPERYYEGETEKLVIAPADGTIVVVEEVDENEYFKVDIPETFKEEIAENGTYKWISDDSKNNDNIIITIKYPLSMKKIIKK